MDWPFPTTEVVEGRARLLVPDVVRRKGPNPKGPFPFYNPTMAVNRDLSALVLGNWRRPLGDVLDGLAATGAWGIRMALEANVRSLTLNDGSPLAATLAQENAARNGVPTETVSADFRDVVGKSDFGYVDIDPFGPPTPFLGHALYALQPGAGLGVTATDTAPLFGTYPRTCERRYAARPLRCEQGHEIGLRILLGYAERVAQVHGKFVRPLLAFHAGHFLRLHLEILDGSGERPSRLGYVTRDSTGVFAHADGQEPEAVGPLWTGALADLDFLRNLAAGDCTSPQTARLLVVLQSEADLPPFFVTTSELARRFRGSPPKIDRFLAELRALGYRAARTHFHEYGVKTDAPAEDVARAFRAAMPSAPTAG
jgi:tRNA (guanine26-N2/guanine27-N2)-dimethyltransferase